MPTAAVPTIPPACVDKLVTCKQYDPEVCKGYGAWAAENCRQFCGFCSEYIISS